MKKENESPAYLRICKRCKTVERVWWLSETVYQRISAEQVEDGDIYYDEKSVEVGDSESNGEICKTCFAELIQSEAPKKEVESLIEFMIENKSDTISLEGAKAFINSETINNIIEETKQEN